MGLKKFFKIKPPPEATPEENREMLGDLGITVKNPDKKHREKFAAYGQFARDRGVDKFYAPEGYEQYARPPQPDLEAGADDDLNQSIVDADSEVQKEKPHKKNGLFGRKKSAKHNSRGSEIEQRDTSYDPYSVSTDLNAPPYGATENKYGSSSLSDPYQRSSDPYNSYSSNSNDGYNRSTDPYSAKKDSYSYDDSPYSNNNDPYNPTSQYSRNPSQPKPNATNPYDMSTNAGTNPYENSNELNSYNNNNNNLLLPQSSSINTPLSSNDNSRSIHPYESGRISSTASRRNPSANPYNVRNSLKRNSNNTGVGIASGMVAGSTAAAGATATSTLMNNDLNNTASPGGNYNDNIAKANTPINTGNPYGSMSTNAYNNANDTSNPYQSLSENPYGSSTNLNTNPYGVSSNTNSNPYGVNPPSMTQNVNTLNRANTTFTERDTTPTVTNTGLMEVMYDTQQANDVALNDELDLNATIDDYNKDTVGDDLNADLNERIQEQQFVPQQTFMQEQQGYPYGEMATEEENRGFKTFEEVQREEEERQQQEEEEAVDELKQQIRFTKQSSVASTRNTLRMAQEAENAGMNTLGMLGHQSEKLNNVERNLDLIKIQNSVADNKVEELKKLNRNILAVHVSNPFNSNRRRRQREEAIKNKKIEEHIMMEATNNELARSTNRIENAMNGNMHSDSGIRERYQRQIVLEKAAKYQFENDEEDNEMEVEIDRNLEQIGQISSRLKKMAISTGEELDAQQSRLNNIENSTDDLDIKIHINTTKLAGIK